MWRNSTASPFNAYGLWWPSSGQKVIFTIGDYLGLYNEAFGTSRKASEPPKHPDRLIVRLEALDGKFDHCRPAKILLRSPVEKLSQSTLSNFENLTRRINETHA